MGQRVQVRGRGHRSSKTQIQVAELNCADTWVGLGRGLKNEERGGLRRGLGLGRTGTTTGRTRHNEQGQQERRPEEEERTEPGEVTVRTSKR
jgi:hypothetical protein